MLILKIATTIWLTLIALIMANGVLNRKADAATRLTSAEVMFGQILAIAFMWQ